LAKLLAACTGLVQFLAARTCLHFTNKGSACICLQWWASYFSKVTSPPLQTYTCRPFIGKKQAMQERAGSEKLHKSCTGRKLLFKSN